MSAALGLAPLLAALREAGLPVGVTEIGRLQQVFSLGPQLAVPEDRRLKAVLRAVLVKSAEDRARFEPVFDAWLDRAGQEVSLREAPPTPDPIPVPRKPRPGRYVWRVVTPVLLVLLSLMLGGHLKTKETPQLAGPLPTSREEAKTILATIPVPTPTPAEPPKPGNPVWRGWPALTLGILALLAAGGLWIALRKRSWLPEPAPEPVKKGPPRVFLTPPQLAGPQLLEPREEEALVWGIGHFVADEPTRRLDLTSTVRETARAAGIPHLRFHHARYPREVWLWIDEAADDPAIPRLADEIEEALRIHSLPVERALFRGVPDWLVNSAGQAFAPNEVDERRDAALVAILTDGRVLARQYAADDRKVKLDALLRGLSHWPRLAFVDFAAEPGDLAAILMKHSLLRITPVGLAAFLGNDEGVKQTRATAKPDAIWAAACALAPSSVDEARAFEIRRRLELAVSPLAFRALRAEAPGPPGRLQWQPEVRARRVNWLREAEGQIPDEVASGSLLAQAVRFWEEVYDGELRERNTRAKEDAWLNTPAYQHLTMERALLALWRDAPNAVKQLYRFYGGPLRETIQGHLRHLAPLDWGGPEHVHLPWTWAERFGAGQVMLLKMGLGGGMPAAALRRPGRLWLGLGLCLGLAAGAFGAALFQKEPCRNGELLEENGMTFVRICPGTFTMGSDDDDPLADDDEKPAHEVTLSELWFGRTEVTNAQYGKGAGSLPVTEVTWHQAKAFCERNGWRLPTEAEWESAARAGTPTPWSFGADETQLGEYAWFGEGLDSAAHPVATKKPNSLGIHDMHGNVWEWVEDWYGVYERGAQTDPKGPAAGEFRPVRGGSFINSPWDLRSAFRGWLRPADRGGGVGFRCARSPSRQP